VLWDEMLNSDEGEKIKKILAIDGKTQRGNGNKNQKANHIVSAVDENGFCLLEKQAAFNLNILKKLALKVLKIFDIGKKPMSLKLKRFSIGTNPEKHLESILSL
ncbi:MAG: hypothetical protein FWH04_06390, partial [Oscillospiraceae bacterium]|nr:hypothetical protein [Oscillospiraceae bacterium]